MAKRSGRLGEGHAGRRVARRPASRRRRAGARRGAAATRRVRSAQERIAELRFFGGLSLEETGHVLGISVATVERDWQAARAWLFAQLKGSASS